VRVGQELKIPEVEGLPFLVEGQVEETKTVALPKEQILTGAEAEKPKEAEISEKPRKSARSPSRLKIRQAIIVNSVLNSIKTKNIQMPSLNSIRS
jgi:hypothetical protein